MLAAKIHKYDPDVLLGHDLHGSMIEVLFIFILILLKFVSFTLVVDFVSTHEVLQNSALVEAWPAAKDKVSRVLCRSEFSSSNRLQNSKRQFQRRILYV